MATIKKSIVINASTDEIDTYAIDAHTYPQWFAGVESVDVDGVFPEVGGTVALRYKSAGLTMDMTMKSLAIEHGKSLTIEMDGMISGTQSWLYEAVDGGTKVNCTFDYNMKGGGLGAIADKLVAERMNTQNLEKSLESLKQIVEG